MLLRSERIVGPDGAQAGELTIEGGLIASVAPLSRDTRSDAIELGTHWVVPGYLDCHVHGGGGAQCNTSDAGEIAEVARFHVQHGTTGMLATLLAAPQAELEAGLRAIAQCPAPTLLGVHLEGPFLSPRRPGAMDAGAFLEPDEAQLERLLAAAAGRLRVMTLAPELPGAMGVIELLAHSGVVVSIGHSDATDAEVRAAVRAGASSATHVFNAMPPLHQRVPGVVGAALDLPEVSCELICDGVHVDPVVMRLVYRAKGLAGVRLVTDATAAAGMPDGEYPLGGRAVSVTEGIALLKDAESISGSTLTMEAAVQNAVRWLRISVEEAVIMASSNPARLLGLADRKGAIRSGLDADLVVLDEELAVRATMVAGEWRLGPNEAI